MNIPSLLVQSALGLLVLISSGCGARMSVATGTTLGLVANSGDGSSRPPRVTLGYRRAEVAIIPTDGTNAVGAATNRTDAYSSLAAFDFETHWFGKTTVQQFIATGHASRKITEKDSRFHTAFAPATIGPVDAAILKRRADLIQKIKARLGPDPTPAQKEALFRQLLVEAHYPDPGQPAEQTFQVTLGRTRDDAAMTNLEAAWSRLP